MNATATFNRSIDTQLLVDRLTMATEGEIIDYATLSGIIKRDVTNGARGSLIQAMRIVLSEHKIVFATVRKVGIKRLSASESVDLAGTSVTKIHREAKRGAKKIQAVEYDKLDQGGQLKHNATAAVLAALHESTTRKRVLQVEKAVENRTKLAVAETLAALAGK